MYVCKTLLSTHKKFVPMEGECYALEWRIIHFQQYLHLTFCMIRRNHK